MDAGQSTCIEILVKRSGPS